MIWSIGSFSGVSYNMPGLENPSLHDLVEVVYYEDLIIDPRKQLFSILGWIIPYEHIPVPMTLIPFRAPSDTHLQGRKTSLLSNFTKILMHWIIVKRSGFRLFLSPFRIYSKLSLGLI